MPHPYRRAFEARDLEALRALLTDDVVFHSPVIGEPGFQGKAAVSTLIEVVFDATTDLAYTHEYGDDRARVFVFESKILGKPTRATNLIELDADGMIREIWVMARPLTALAAITEAIGSGLARRRSPARGAAVRAASKGLAGVAVLTDRIGARVIARHNRDTA
jgi:hypothetical protein